MDLVSGDDPEFHFGVRGRKELDFQAATFLVSEAALSRCFLTFGNK